MATDKKISENTLSTNAPSGSMFPYAYGGLTYRISKENLVGTPTFSVLNYGAIGDGSTDDSTAVQAAFTAAIAAGGGKVVFPSGYNFKIVTGISINPITLTNFLFVESYGAKITYTGSGDAIAIETNIAGSDVQHAQRSVHWYGLHLIGSSSAICGIRLRGATLCTFTDTVIEDFTKTTTDSAAVVLDALFHYWAEENHFLNLDIKNTGNGICFISREDSAGTAASTENNYFTNTHIWLTQASGKGIYGHGYGATTVANSARCAFYGIVIHPVNIANAICFDLTSVYIDGGVFISPSIDIFGTCATLTGFKYTFSQGLTILGPTCFPLAGIASFFTGGGNFVVLGGNVPSTLTIDGTGNIVAPTYNKVTITAPASASTLTIANGKTLTASNSITLAGTDGKTLTLSNSLTFTGTDGNSFAFPAGGGTVVEKDATQTLTAKTLTSPVINQFGTASGLGAAWDAWTSPVNANLTPGNGVQNYAQYKQYGKTVVARYKFTLGSTSSIGGVLTFNFPVTNSASGYAVTEESLMSTVTFNDSGVNTYAGVAVWASTTTFTLRALNAGSTYLLTNNTSATIPFTFGTSDFIQFHILYEVA